MNERTVLFTTVLVRMRGPLFPEDDSSKDGVSRSLGSSWAGSMRRLIVWKKTAVQVQLFEELVKTEFQEGAGIACSLSKTKSHCCSERKNEHGNPALFFSRFT